MKHIKTYENFSNLEIGDYVIAKFNSEYIIKITHIHPYDFDYGGSIIIDNKESQVGVGFDNDQIIMKISEDEIDEYRNNPELFKNAKKYNL
jgi:hypothetical protein